MVARFDLSGKRALITGGGRGLGREMAQAFAEHGADVIIASRKLDVLEQTAAEITQQINKFSKEFDNYSAAVDKVRATFNKLDNELGAIATDGTRFRKLSVPIRDIEKLRKRQGIGELDAATDDVLNESVDDF